MAPRVAKNLEVFFIILVVIIFGVVSSKYFGSEVRKGISKVLAKVEVYRIYSHYENLASGISAPKKSDQSELLVPVLVYHGIVPGKPRNEEEVSLDDFTEQMFTLKKNGYQTISMDEFYQFAIEGKLPPEKSFVLTFDDGRKDSYYPVDPILKALGFSATMFVITNTLNVGTPSPYYLSTEELKRMMASGRWELESHGRDDHVLIPLNAAGGKGRFMSNKKWLTGEERLESDDEYRNRLISDLENAKKDLQSIFGVEAKAYALPFGDYGHNVSNYSDAERVIQDVLRETYSISFFQANREVRTGYFRANYFDSTKNQYFFRRIKVLDTYRADDLLNIVQASREKILPYENDFSNMSDWVLAWGEIDTSKNRVILKNSDGTNNSAAIFLDGSELWRDYRFDMTAQLIKGNNYNLFARVKNGKDYVGCAFEQNEVTAFTVENETYTVIARKSILNTGIMKKDVTASINVYGENLECLLNGKMQIKSALSSGHELGGIGLGVFSADKNAPATLDIVRNITVSESK